MKKNNLTITLSTVTVVVLAFVSFITYSIFKTTREEEAKAKPAETETNLKLNYSPNGKYLILNDHKKLNIYEINSGKKIQEIVINGEPSLTFSPDSKSIAFIDKSNQIKILNLDESKPIQLIDIK